MGRVFAAGTRSRLLPLLGKVFAAGKVRARRESASNRGRGKLHRKPRREEIPAKEGSDDTAFHLETTHRIPSVTLNCVTSSDTDCFSYSPSCWISSLSLSSSSPSCLGRVTPGEPRFVRTRSSSPVDASPVLSSNASAPGFAAGVSRMASARHPTVFGRGPKERAAPASRPCRKRPASPPDTLP